MIKISICVDLKPYLIYNIPSRKHYNNLNEFLEEINDEEQKFIVT